MNHPKQYWRQWNILDEWKSLNEKQKDSGNTLEKHKNMLKEKIKCLLTHQQRIISNNMKSTVPLHQAGAAYRSASGHNPPSPAG